MPQFMVDDDLVELVWRLARPQPFENLPFSAALRRVIQNEIIAVRKDANQSGLEDLHAEGLVARAGAKKAVSPNPAEWVANVSELKAKRG